MIKLLIAAVIIGTWNGNWFPSGRAEHRAHPKVEEATTVAAAEMLSKGIAALDEGGTNEVVIILNEMRSPEVVSNLVEKMNCPNLRVASVSRYRRRDRFDQQQDAIITTLPIVDSGWGVWPAKKKVKAPRGTAFSTLIFPNNVTTEVYAVHLKSNYGATSEKIKEENRLKRSLAVEDLISRAGSKHKSKIDKMIIAGDFNADKYKMEFESENIFTRLEEVGFKDVSEKMEKAKRYSHPNKRWGNSLLDYIFVKGFDDYAIPLIIENDELSDHLAIFTVIR